MNPMSCTYPQEILIKRNVNGSIIYLNIILTFELFTVPLFIILQAQDLLAREFSGTADPYAKIRLLPDRNNVWQTRIHKKTLNPGNFHVSVLFW